MLEKGTVTLGVNYWASHAATEMWRKWDAEVIEKDLSVIAQHGMELIRVFPLWSDFQPLNIIKYCGPNGGRPRDMRLGEEELPLPDTPAGRAGMSEVMMERFEAFADIAERCGLKLIVSLMTAHMTGRLYVPKAMENRDLFKDPFALKWQARFYDYFVRRLKSHPAIFAWETGNESGHVSPAGSPEAAWVWTAYIHNFIRLADDSHPIVGVPVYGINPLGEQHWLVQDQAELADFNNIHKYDLTTTAVSEGFNHIRNVFRAVADNCIAEDIGGKPCFIEETGLWRNIATSLRTHGDAVRNIMWNVWANNCRALLWWCAFDQEKFDIAPYNWGEWPGLEHGIFSDDHQPHPAALAMKKFRFFLDGLPFSELPQLEADAVCLINEMEVGYASFVLARQAGINLRFHSTRDKLPDADVYFLPSIKLRGGLSTVDWEALQKKVREGATLYLSSEDCNLSRLKEVCGMEICRRRERNDRMTYNFGDYCLELPRKLEKTLENCSAEVIAEDRDGNPVFLKHQYGKGLVYTLMFPLEQIVSEGGAGFDLDCWKIYRALLPKTPVALSRSSSLVISEHYFPGKKECALVLVNCSFDPLKDVLEIAGGWQVESQHSDASACSFDGRLLQMPPNSGLLLMLRRG